MRIMDTPSPRNSTAAAALGIALVTGIAADLLLRASRPGLNLWVLSIGLQLQLGLLHRRYRTSIPWTSFALLLGSGCFLFSFAWRDSEALNLLAMGGSLTAAGLAAWVAQGASLRRSTTMQYLFGVSRAAGAALVGVIPLALVEADWTPYRSTLGGNRFARVGRGLALAVPPVVIFGALFAAADPIFKGFYSQLFDFNPATLVEHAVIIGVVFWVVAGFLRAMIIPGVYPPVVTPSISGGRLGFTEMMVVLGAVSLTFLLFVAIQLRTLFGGDAFVLGETGLTYAEYARQGFFHMAWAVALVLPLLLFMEWVGRRDNAREQRSFRALTTLLLGLLGLVLLSAFHRMRVYQESYGLTELRVYTVAFMAWLAPVLAWLGLTVLAGRRERFIPGVLSFALIAVLVLHLVNPDDLIMRTNLERASRGQSFDVRHAVSLSDDAMPLLTEALPSMPRADQCVVLDRVLRERGKGDWRSWNRSRSRMDQLVEGMSPTILQLKAHCPETTT